MMKGSSAKPKPGASNLPTEQDVLTMLGQPVFESGPAKPVEVPSPFTPDWNTPYNAVSGLARGAANVVTAVPSALATIGKQGWTGAFKSIVSDPMKAEWEKANQDLNAVHPDPMSAFGHRLASVFPVVGPWAAGLGERAGQGDISGATAEAAATLGAPHIAGSAGPESAMKAAPKVAGSLMDRAISNRMEPPAPNILTTLTKMGLGYGIGELTGHPKLGAAVGGAIDLLRQSPTFRNMKASAQNALAKEIIKINPPEPPLPPIQGPARPPASQPSVQVVPQGKLPPGKTPLQLTGETAGAQPKLNAAPGHGLPAGTASVEAEPQLPQAYRELQGPTPPPGTMGDVKLGQEGGIAPRGEQTVTGTHLPLRRATAGDGSGIRPGAFRPLTETERAKYIEEHGNIGKAPTEPPKPPTKKK